MKHILVLLVVLLAATSCQSVVVTMDAMEARGVSVQETSGPPDENKDNEKEKP